MLFEGKITDKTFEETKKQIIEDIKFIDNNSGDDDLQRIKDDYINLIINLNK